MNLVLDELGLLLADSAGPLLPAGLPARSYAKAPRALQAQPGREFMYSDDTPPDDLATQRWGVIVPAGGDLVPWRQVAPLIEARAREQQLRPEDVKRYEFPREADPTRWISDTLGTLDSKRPRYLLLLGDLGELPLELQTRLCDFGYYPGRLAFTTPEHYGDYAAKVLAWERKHQGSRARIVMVTARTTAEKSWRDAPDLGYDELMRPAFEFAARMRGENEPGYAREVEQSGAGVPVPLRCVLDAAQGTETPTVLWTMSHGASGDADSAGELLFGARGGASRLRAGDVARAPFLPGGVWFMFACYGAAVPRQSLYWPWLGQLKAAGDPELARYDPDRALTGLSAGDGFVSPIPRAALANLDGPLAVVGHADLAWIHSFKRLPGAGADPRERFLRLPRCLADPTLRSRIGHAFARFRNLAALDATLLTYVARAEAAIRRGEPYSDDPIVYGRLWMHRQDLASYMLLGDPAVRLPFA